jgi:hypothetical protein
MLDEGKVKPHKAEETNQAKQRAPGQQMSGPGLASLQQLVGNQAVQRLLAQRSGESGFELDDETASRINRERGGGQPLDTALQKQASETTGHDLSGVRVHTSPEAGDLSDQLRAKAFATGEDVFFGEGAYDPHSSEGRELIAHELTHVVQQSTGAVGSTGKMTVNPPGDSYEQEADTVAQSITATAAETGVQREAELVNGMPTQRQPMPEEELVQPQAIQRQEVPEEEVL